MNRKLILKLEACQTLELAVSGQHAQVYIHVAIERDSFPIISSEFFHRLSDVPYPEENSAVFSAEPRSVFNGCAARCRWR